MSYQIYDNGASIRIVNNTGEKLVMKHQVVQLSIVSDSIIKIDQGDPLTAIYINFSEVTDPLAATPGALRDLLNTYITNCVCSSCSGSPSSGGQVEANNGLSIENNKLVLGEALNSELGAATLINNRQINTNGYSVKLKSGESNSTTLSGETVKVVGVYDPNSSTGTDIPGMISIGNLLGKVRSTNLIRRDNGLYISTDNRWAPLILQDNGKIVYGGADGSTFSDTTADFNCNASAGFMKSVKHYTDNAVIGESFTGNIVFTNLGAQKPIVLSLAATTIGSFFTFYIREPQTLNIRTVSNNGIIQIYNDSTDYGMPIFSDMLGSSVTLCLIAPDEWVAIALIGYWQTRVNPA